MATAATAPVRSAVTERASSTISGCPVVASERQITPVTVGRPRAGLPGNEVIHFSNASPPPRAGIARKSPYGGLWRYTLAGITQSPAPKRKNASRTRVDRGRRRDGPQNRVVVEHRELWHRRHDTLGATVNRRPKLTIVAPDASAEEAAAVVAALERFMRDTAPPRTAPPPQPSPWLLAALQEGITREPAVPPPWM